jgi:DNA-binding NarL/FixJ family response regulator
LNNPQKSIRIILVDDQTETLGNLRAALALSNALQLVGQAGSSQEAVQLCQLTGPDVALVNLASANLDGIGVVNWLVQYWPQLTILVMVGANTEAQLRAALQAGAAGYLPQDADPQALASIIEHVMESRRNLAQPAGPQAVSFEAPPRPESSLASGLRSGELAEAARIQNSLLPAEPPAIPGWELAVKMQPARETSGDFFDFLPLEHGKYGIVIGDVSDKGLGAALFMAMTSTLFRTFTARQPSLPALTIGAVNERILSDTGGSSFVTAFLGILEPQTGRLRYVNAGHVPPLMLSAQKSKRLDRLSRTGMALGVLKEASWQQKLVKLIPGDLLLLYTDGILDAQNRHGEFYGEPRLLQAARAQSSTSARQIVDSVLSDIAGFTGSAPVNDDVILMVLKRKL